MAILGAFCLLAFALALLFRIQKYPGGYYFLIVGAISFVILMPTYIIGKYQELVSGNKTNWIVVLILGSMFLSLFLPMNISRYFLREYTQTDRRLIEQAAAIQKRTEDLYSEFYSWPDNDSLIYRPKGQALDVKYNTESICTFIEDLKLQLIGKIEGVKGREPIEELLHSGTYDKGDFDVAVTILVMDGWGRTLKRELSSLRELYLSKISKENGSLAETIENLLNTDDPPVQGDEPQHSWESAYFEGIPAVAVIANLSQIQANLRYAEYFVVDDLWKNAQIERQIKSKQ
jgi:hypothetical protein